VGLRAGLNAEARGKILCRGSNLSQPVCNQTLYCRGSQTFIAIAPIKMFHEIHAPSTRINSNKQILREVQLMNNRLF
jgi:hypothetical protein